MPDESLIAEDPKRDPINLDYRILSLVLFCATRPDLLKEYLDDKDKEKDKKWPNLRGLGLPLSLLEDSFYLFKDRNTQLALGRLQLVTQTMVSLNDYCVFDCPVDDVLKQIALQNSLQQQPLQIAGVED